MPEGKKIKKLLRVDKQVESGLSAFVERPLPTDKEVINFERLIGKEKRDQEIDSNLSEIYQDKKGSLVNTKKMKARPRLNLFFRLFKNLFILIFLGLVAYLSYNYLIINNNNDLSALEIKIIAPEKIIAGEEFSYKVEYHNPTKFIFSKLRLEMQYPENFIFSGSSLPPTSGNYGWNLPNLEPGASASLSITGKLINKPDSVNVVAGRLNYYAASYSSQFKKEASVSTIISDSGWQIDLESSRTAFLNQDNDLTLIFSDVKNNYLGDFDISFAVPAEANAWVVMRTSSSSQSGAGFSSSTVNPLNAQKITITKTGGALWTVSGLNQEIGRQVVPLQYKISNPNGSSEVTVRLSKKMEDGQAYTFWEKIVTPELVKSDLNLTLFLNGAKTDGAINFDSTLTYTLSYKNQGANFFKDVIILASLKGDFLDFNSLKSDQNGSIKDNTLVWTKNEIPELAEIKPGQEGEINFSLNLKPFQEGDLGKNLSVVSYAQYSVDNKAVSGDNNKSNTITSLLNSDLTLNEQIRYFDENNIPVGSGPLPPKVNEKTSFRVYWAVKNNLHELSETRVVFNLPAYVKWDEKSTTNVGNIYYDATSHQVIWEIGRLPVSVYRADAEFNISLTPTDNDLNKILVLSPGSLINAMDTVTKGTITKKTDPKTTKLEDDDIAGLSNNGRVQ